MKTMQELSDAGIMVKLGKELEELVKIAVSRGIKIEMYADRDGFHSVRVGDYRFAAITVSDWGIFQYAPEGDTKKWRDVTPQEIGGGISYGRSI